MKVCDINIYLTQLHYTYMYIYSKYVFVKANWQNLKDIGGLKLSINTNKVKMASYHFYNTTIR